MDTNGFVPLALKFNPNNLPLPPSRGKAARRYEEHAV